MYIAFSGNARNFHLGDYIAQGVWGRKSPSGVRGQGPGTGEAEAICRHWLQMTAETVEI